VNRQLLVLLALLALVAGGALFVMHRKSALAAPDLEPSTALPVAPPESVSAPAEEKPSLANPEPSLRAPAAEKPEATRTSETQGSPPTRKGKPAAFVGLVVQFAGTHAPVRNALACLTYELPGGKGENERMQPQKDGRFELAVPLGAHLLALDVCGTALMLEGPRLPSNEGARFRPLRTAIDTTISAAGAELHFEVEPARDLEGVVLDKQTRAPVAGADVDLWMPIGRRMHMRTAADGKFELTEPGTARPLRVSCDGYLEMELALQPADLGAPDPGLVVLLDRGLRLCGSVFDAHGAPLRSATLELHARGIEPEGRVVPTDDKCRARTDEQGKFCFENVPRCAQATIFEQLDDRLERPMRMRAGRELGPLKSDVDGLFLVCRDATLIDLRIVRGDGTPVAPGKYFCSCEDAGLIDDVIAVTQAEVSQRILAVGVAVRLFVFARAREDDPYHLLVGRRTLELDKREPNPLEVRIVVDEPLDVTPPASSAPEIAAHEDGVLATLDLLLIDASGKPFQKGTPMEFEFGGSLYGQVAPDDSELRLRCHPSHEAYRARVQIGGQSRSFDLVVPPGYSRAEQRIWIVP